MGRLQEQYVRPTRSSTFEHCAGYLEKEHGLPAADHREELPCRILASTATVFLWSTTFGGYRLERSSVVGGVQFVEEDMNGEHLTGFWWCSLAQTKTRRRCSGKCAQAFGESPQDGDSPIQNIIMGPKEKSRERITNGLRNFTTSDNHSAVEVGHLRRGQRPFNVVRPNMNGDS